MTQIFQKWIVWGNQEALVAQPYSLQRIFIQNMDFALESTFIVKSGSTNKKDWKPFSIIAGNVNLWIRIKIAQVMAFSGPLAVLVSKTHCSE